MLAGETVMPDVSQTITPVADAAPQVAQSTGSRRSGYFGRWLIRRTAASLLVLLVVSLLVFWATQGLPGDVAKAILGRGATPEQLEVVRQRLNLDAPLAVQYWDWLRTLVTTGSPGTSLTSGVPVWEMVKSSMANSYTLVLVSMAITFPCSVVLGVWTAYRRDRFLDRSLLGFSMGVNALPEFVIGTLLIVIFATNVFDILPAISLIPPGDPVLAHVPELVLPVATLCLLGITYLYRLVRASVIDVLDSEYVQMAVLKGLSTRRVLLRHALPNAIVPTLQATAIVTAYSLGGVVVVEYVFGFPGLGSALTQAIGSRDLPVIQFIVLVIAGSFVLLNLLADALGVYLTPKARQEGRDDRRDRTRAHRP
jgi:peptide/nickel transport system permease protein